MNLLGKLFKKKIIKEVGVSRPYIITIKNTSSEAKDVFLFGEAMWGHKKNYGNDDEIIISVNSGVEYPHLVKQSAYNPFIATKFRVISSNLSNLCEEFNYVNHNANGCFSSTPTTLSVLKDLFQFSTDAIDFTKNIEINCNTYLKIRIRENSEIMFCIYPTTIFTYSEDRPTRLVAPKLSGFNVAPVIIRTWSNMTGTTVSNIYFRFIDKVRSLFKKNRNDNNTPFS